MKKRTNKLQLSRETLTELQTGGAVLGGQKPKDCTNERSTCSTPETMQL